MVIQYRLKDDEGRVKGRRMTATRGEGGKRAQSMRGNCP